MTFPDHTLNVGDYYPHLDDRYRDDRPGVMRAHTHLVTFRHPDGRYVARVERDAASTGGPCRHIIAIGYGDTREQATDTAYRLWSGDPTLEEAIIDTIIPDTPATSPPFPPFRGRVHDAGGGMVTVLVDRDTAAYPAVGAAVTVTPGGSP